MKEKQAKFFAKNFLKSYVIGSLDTKNYIFDWLGPFNSKDLCFNFILSFFRHIVIPFPYIKKNHCLFTFVTKSPEKIP